jgi:esterase/lipase
MMTHNFPTVKRLAESLNESGYNVLTPSLSLGISQRRKSMACEAIHLHSLEEDIKELEQWIQWSEKKTDKDIILIGHSTGSIHLASYLSSHPENQITQVIFIAMPDFNMSNKLEQINKLQKKAQQLILNNNQSLHDFTLSYCDKYPTTATNFLSYLQLSKENISLYINKIVIPKTLIIGSNDNRVDQTWSKTLTQHGVNVIRVDGANHFFDNEHEFDLLDIIENILNNKQLAKLFSKQQE